MKIKKNDIVKLILGEDRGKQGKVLQIIGKSNRCIVEGINFQIKHTRPKEPHEPAGRLKKEGSVHLSNLSLICPKCGEPTKVKMIRIENKRARTCKKCNELIDE